MPSVFWGEDASRVLASCSHLFPIKIPLSGSWQWGCAVSRAAGLQLTPSSTPMARPSSIVSHRSCSLEVEGVCAPGEHCHSLSPSPCPDELPGQWEPVGSSSQCLRLSLELGEPVEECGRELRPGNKDASNPVTLPRALQEQVSIEPLITKINVFLAPQNSYFIISYR